MVERNAYTIHNNKVISTTFNIKWMSGFSLSQKRKNIENLHSIIQEKYNTSLDSILEVSTKSTVEVGRLLSSMNLKVKIKDTYYCFESVYQSSKVYQASLLDDEYQMLEWLSLTGFEVKKLSKEIKHNLIKFKCEGIEYPLNPPTLFYDYLYIRSVVNIPDLYEKISRYTFFTDIEFNPNNMISTQAKSICLYKLLYENNHIKEYLSNPKEFYE